MQIASLQSLDSLELEANMFPDLLPDQLGNLVKLLHLNLSQNKFMENISSDW